MIAYFFIQSIIFLGVIWPVIGSTSAKWICHIILHILKAPVKFIAGIITTSFFFKSIDSRDIWIAEVALDDAIAYFAFVKDFIFFQNFELQNQL